MIGADNTIGKKAHVRKFRRVERRIRVSIFSTSSSLAADLTKTRERHFTTATHQRTKNANKRTQTHRNLGKAVGDNARATAHDLDNALGGKIPNGTFINLAVPVGQCRSLALGLVIGMGENATIARSHGKLGATSGPHLNISSWRLRSSALGTP